MLSSDTPTSSPSISSSIPESSDHCRGIINPNYPGFQHLAHTLSEHFFDDHHFAQSSEDSDLSEFEVEQDRREYLNGHHFSAQTSPCNNNNNNNNIDDNSETLKKIEDLIRGAFHSRESEPPGYAESISSGYTRIMDNAVDGHDFHAYSVLDSLENPYEEKDKHIVSHEMSNDEKRNTPDILRKTISKSEYLNGHAPPDILQNVMTKTEQEIEDSMVEKALEWIYIGKEGALEEVGDIVGDFEQEVQHELGLIVSGYSKTPSSYAVDTTVLQAQQETLACLLSNADKMERLLEKVIIYNKCV